MSVSWRQLPEPARTIGATVTDAVSAARATDPAALRHAAERLVSASAVRAAPASQEQVGVVLGAVLRSLLEETHPDGLSGEDVQAVLEDCVRSAASWFPTVDIEVLVILLTGALGIHQVDPRPSDPQPDSPPDFQPDVVEAGGAPRRLGALEVASHAPLLLADLLAVSGRPLSGHLDAAFAEIYRAETIEMP
jgi:hypothetical protein